MGVNNYVKFNKEQYLKDIDKALNELPKTQEIVSSFVSINVDDLKDAVDRFNYVPNYQDLLEENKALKEEKENLSKQNNDLRKIYVNTYNRLFKNGNDELARYFQAQINDCPTFYVAPIIDYYKVLKNIKQDLDLELNKTRVNDEYNKGLFNEALYIRKQIEKYEGEINAN